MVNAMLRRAGQLEFFILCIAAFGFIFVVCSLFLADFELMWLATLGSITNAGGLAVMAAILSSIKTCLFGHIFLAMVMIAGRLELFVVLVLLTPAFGVAGIRSIHGKNCIY